ncbi:MAG TPA: 6,7-dimethyl-8-ribityllumazine synthase [bacterium]|nr:6,7-dimethyl-8-ribityllumazine synthase [bacterium]
MPTTTTGGFDGQGHAFAIVASRFNSFIVERLVAGALDAFIRHGVDADAISIYWVPGAFEIPLVCQRVAAKGEFDAILALACVLRGETPHFDYVAGELTKGVSAVSLTTDTPILYGAITAETLDQAVHRAGAKSGNKGFEAAVAAIELVNLLEQI